MDLKTRIHSIRDQIKDVKLKDKGLKKIKRKALPLAATLVGLSALNGVPAKAQTNSDERQDKIINVISKSQSASLEGASLEERKATLEEAVRSGSIQQESSANTIFDVAGGVTVKTSEPVITTSYQDDNGQVIAIKFRRESQTDEQCEYHFREYKSPIRYMVRENGIDVMLEESGACER